MTASASISGLAYTSDALLTHLTDVQDSHEILGWAINQSWLYGDTWCFDAASHFYANMINPPTLHPSVASSTVYTSWECPDRSIPFIRPSLLSYDP